MKLAVPGALVTKNLLPMSRPLLAETAPAETWEFPLWTELALDIHPLGYSYWMRWQGNEQVLLPGSSWCPD